MCSNLRNIFIGDHQFPRSGGRGGPLQVILLAQLGGRFMQPSTPPGSG